MSAAFEYDAFISYSHSHDELLAPALHAGLQRFAKPWFLQFTVDGRYLLSATAGGKEIQWDLDTADLTRNVCATVGGALTAAEWRRYVGTTAPARMPCTSATG